MGQASPISWTQYVSCLESQICLRYAAVNLSYSSAPDVAFYSMKMRAQNQQDLIYKRGQAGITKASVTIVFDNSDREKSPVGLEDCKQITVTRQVSCDLLRDLLLANG
jgi:hypothetical protein